MTPHHPLRLPVSGFDGQPLARMAVDLFIPKHWAAQPLLLVCLAGGGMNRHYFNLEAAGDAASYSFAAAMCAAGYAVALVDHPGIGDSEGPIDGYELTAAVVAQRHAEVCQQLLVGLQQGSLIDAVTAIPKLRSVGVGHSMGGLLTTYQQALHANHVGLVLLGFSTQGLPAYLSPAVQARLATDRAAVMAEHVAHARRMFGADPYPRIQPSRDGKVLYAGANAELPGLLALKPCLAPLLPVPAYHAMLPGNVAEQAAHVRVPVFFGVGENDMTGPAERVGEAFLLAATQHLEVLPATGHNHFVFATRHRLFAAISQWLARAL